MKMIRRIFATIKIVKFMYWVRFTKRVVPFANMFKTEYSPYEEINDQQMEIMIFIDKWVRTEKTPVPRQKIMAEMKARKIPSITVEWSLNVLLRKGYIRRAIITSNKTSYVQLRNINRE